MMVSLICMYCLANAEIQFETLAMSCLSSSLIGYVFIIKVSSSMLLYIYSQAILILTSFTLE